MTRSEAFRDWTPSATPALLAGDRPRAIAQGVDRASRLCLRIVATSDLHASLLPYDYCADRPVSGRSLADIAGQIAAARAEVPNTVLLDNGDFLQGSPLADFVARTARRRRPHPVIAAFNALNYDAVTLGNHDFDYGLEFLAKSIAQARFPVVSANIATRLGRTPGQDQTLVPPYALLRRKFVDEDGRMHNLRIGVIGFAPPQIEIWERDRLNGKILTRDILASARAWLPRLRAAGADVIVALAHTGIGSPEASEGMENAATALADLEEVDAVVAGHSHLAFPGPGFAALPGVDPVNGRLAGKPAVMPGYSGSHFGIIDLVLTRDRAATSPWRIVERRARLSIAESGQGQAGCAPGAPSLQRSIAPDHRAALAWSRLGLGRTKVPLTTYFATTAPTAALELVARAKAAHARQALRGTEFARLPVLAMVAPYRVGGLGGPEHFTDIPAGPFRMRNLFDLYPFQNNLVTLALTAGEICDLLERAASGFRRVRPGETDAVLHDPQVPGFAFQSIPGLDYAISLSQPARFDQRGHLVDPNAQRIVGLSLKGRLLDPGEPLLLVTNSYFASRFGTEGTRSPKVVHTDRTGVQPLLADHIRTEVEVGAPPRRAWHFLPMPGTTLRITTGPGAVAHLSDIAHMRPMLLQRDAKGFLHYRLHL